MTDDERLAAIAKQYAVLNNRTSGMVVTFNYCRSRCVPASRQILRFLFYSVLLHFLHMTYKNYLENIMQYFFFQFSCHFRENAMVTKRFFSLTKQPWL